MLFPVGYPLEGVKVPDLVRKPLAEVLITVDGGEDGAEGF